jgi:hypothetical protein
VGCTAFGKDFLSYTITICWLLPIIMVLALCFTMWIRFMLEQEQFRSEIPSLSLDVNYDQLKEEYSRRGMEKEVKDEKFDCNEIGGVLNKLKWYTEKTKRSVIKTKVLHVNELLIQSNDAEYGYEPYTEDEPLDGEGASAGRFAQVQAEKRRHTFTYVKGEGILINKFGEHYKKARWKSFKNKMVVGMIVIYYMIYSTVTLQAAYWLNCDDMGFEGKSERFLSRDMEVSCTSAQYGMMLLTTAIPWSIGVAFLLPLYCLKYLHSKQKNTSLFRPDMVAHFGFVYVGYREETWYWEFIILLRKYLMVRLAV